MRISWQFSLLVSSRFSHEKKLRHLGRFLQLGTLCKIALDFDMSGENLKLISLPTVVLTYVSFTLTVSIPQRTDLII